MPTVAIKLPIIKGWELKINEISNGIYECTAIGDNELQFSMKGYMECQIGYMITQLTNKIKSVK